jgi:hypothetical protein
VCDSSFGAGGTGIEPATFCSARTSVLPNRGRYLANSESASESCAGASTSIAVTTGLLEPIAAPIDGASLKASAYLSGTSALRIASLDAPIAATAKTLSLVSQTNAVARGCLSMVDLGFGVELKLFTLDVSQSVNTKSTCRVVVRIARMLYRERPRTSCAAHAISAVPGQDQAELSNPCVNAIGSPARFGAMAARGTRSPRCPDGSCGCSQANILFQLEIDGCFLFRRMG